MHGKGKKLSGMRDEELAEIFNTPERIKLCIELLHLSCVLKDTIGFDDEKVAIIYLDNLEDIPFETLKAGLKRIVRTQSFFPTIAEIRKICGAEETLSLDEKADLFVLELENAASKYQNRADEAVKNLKPAVFEVVAAFTGLDDPTRAWARFYDDVRKLDSAVEVRQWKKSLKAVSKKVCAEQQLPLSLLQLQN